jgi:hypothetical protein
MRWCRRRWLGGGRARHAIWGSARFLEGRSARACLGFSLLLQPAQDVAHRLRALMCVCFRVAAQKINHFVNLASKSLILDLCQRFPLPHLGKVLQPANDGPIVVTLVLLQY